MQLGGEGTLEMRTPDLCRLTHWQKAVISPQSPVNWSSSSTNGSCMNKSFGFYVTPTPVSPPRGSQTDGPHGSRSDRIKHHYPSLGTHTHNIARTHRL